MTWDCHPATGRRLRPSPFSQCGAWRRGCSRLVAESGPWLHEVSDHSLCGLRQIIDQIACETGVSFHARRIVYGSGELEPSGF